MIRSLILQTVGLQDIFGCPLSGRIVIVKRKERGGVESVDVVLLYASMSVYDSLPRIQRLRDVPDMCVVAQFAPSTIGFCPWSPCACASAITPDTARIE